MKMMYSMNWVIMLLFTLKILFLINIFGSNGGIGGVMGDKILCPPDELKKIDTFTANILSLSSFQRPFPTNRSAMPQYCKETKSDLNELTKLNTKCLTGNMKQFASIILYSVRTTIRNNCQTKNKIKLDNMFKMAKCMNKHQDLAHQCFDIYLDALIRGKRAEPKKSRIGYACCNYYTLLKCFSIKLKNVCTQDSIENLDEFIRNIFQNIIDVACNDFVENSDKCDKLSEPPKRKKSDEQPRSFVFPLIYLWNSL